MCVSLHPLLKQVPEHDEETANTGNGWFSLTKPAESAN